MNLEDSKFTAFLDNLIENKKYRQILFVLLIFFAVIIRLNFAIQLEHPGHGDMSYYLTLANNIADGRGFVIDYIWHFLYPHENLTHPANDFWMPLSSVIMSLFIFILGKSLLTALIPSIIFAVIISLMTYRLARLYLNSRLLAYLAAGMSLFTPHLFKYSLLTDTTIYYTAFITLGLYFIIKAIKNEKYFYLAAVIAGVINLTRQDGILFFCVIIISIIFFNVNIKHKIKLISFCIILYLLVLAPYMISNLYYFGKLYPSASYKFAYLTEYEDHYSYAKEISLSAYLNWGIAKILNLKWQILFPNIKTTLKIFGNVLFPLMAIAIINMFYRLLNRNLIKNTFQPLLYFILLFLFYTLIANFSAYLGGYYRSIQSLTPFFIVFSIDGLNKIIKVKWALYLATGVILILLIIISITHEKGIVDDSRRLKSLLINLKAEIELQHKINDEIIIMTRMPWEMHYSTGYRTIQIPNDDLETIYFVARKYRANYLLLPAPRAALEAIYSGESPDKRFQHLIDLPNTDYKIYKID